ncbi:MAG: hypothetical protein ACI8PZ_004657 [Myxococcota bacterium]|jgi:hypothetical protein
MQHTTALALTLLLTACGQPLELPAQVTDAGHSGTDLFVQPCPTWCSVDEGVRALTNVAGDIIAYEVVQPAAPWDDVMADARRKWGAPTSTYEVAPPPEGSIDLAWFEDRDRLHRRHLGVAHILLDKGDPREVTRFAVWRQGNTLVQVTDDDAELRATWVLVDRVY